jgi:hypothetical protein
MNIPEYMVDLSRINDILAGAIHASLFRFGFPYADDDYKNLNIRDDIMKNIMEKGFNKIISNDYNDTIKNYKSLSAVINKLKYFEEKYGNPNDRKTWEKILNKVIIPNIKKQEYNYIGPKRLLDLYDSNLYSLKNAFTQHKKNKAVSTLQAVLRRTLTKKPEPEKKKAGRPKSSKNDMTEEEKRLERNRKARERYVMKKGQK